MSHVFFNIVILFPVQLLFSMNLAEICDYAKKAREYALLGIYDSSIVYYEGVLQQIHKYCQTLRDPAVKLKWQQVSYQYPACTFHYNQ